MLADLATSVSFAGVSFDGRTSASVVLASITVTPSDEEERTEAGREVDADDELLRQSTELWECCVEVLERGFAEGKDSGGFAGRGELELWFSVGLGIDDFDAGGGTGVMELEAGSWSPLWLWRAFFSACMVRN